jgi:hypothetical protein
VTIEILFLYSPSLLISEKGKLILDGLRVEKNEMFGERGEKKVRCVMLINYKKYFLYLISIDNCPDRACMNNKDKRKYHKDIIVLRETFNRSKNNHVKGFKITINEKMKRRQRSRGDVCRKM